MRVIGPAAILVAGAALGCGDSGARGTTGTGGGEARQAETRLTVTVWPQGREEGASRRWTLTCAPTGGTHPRAAAACRRLASVRRPFAPVPLTTVCTQIYGGPQEALVTGRFRGSRVSARFNRRDGCRIARWDRVAPLFPVPTGNTE